MASQQQASDAPTKPSPWHAIFPTPKAQLPSITPEALAELIGSDRVSGKDYLVVDVRRTDFEDLCIKGALNLPAHSFYQTLPTIVTILSQVPIVIFHCNSCGVGGRGPRTAGWYADALEERGLRSDGVKFLEGGMKAWRAAYGKEERLSTNLPQLA